MKTILQSEAPSRLKLLIFSFMLFSINPLHAQWMQTNGPYGGTVRCLVASGTNLFAGTEDVGSSMKPGKENIRLYLQNRLASR